MNVKNNKGVTLIILIVMIIVLLILTSITISNFKSELSIKNVNSLYADIESISTKISTYYLENNSIPIYEDNPYFNNSDECKQFFMAKGENGDVINPNDEGQYYVIDLSKLENLTLNYGKEYKNWNSESSSLNIQDVYIINKVTHQIYYPKGIKLREENYFTRKISNITSVEEVPTE